MSDENEVFEGEIETKESRVDYDEKENEKRLLIQKRFTYIINIFDETCKNMLELINNREKEDLARAIRISFSENELYLFKENLKVMNRTLGKARPMLDSYIIFSNSTPKFDYVNNLVYKLNSFIIETEKRRFYEIHLMKYNKRYFKYVNMNSIVEELAILIERIKGTLETGGELIVDYPKIQSSGSNNLNDGYDGGYPPRNPYYDNFTPYRGKEYTKMLSSQREESLRTKTVQKTPLRDIGDGYTEK